MREVRRLTAQDVRAFCIAENLYTNGTIAEYNKMLLRADNSEYSVELVEYLANDIYEHSIVDGGYSKAELLNHFMFKIANDCTTSFFEAERQTSNEQPFTDYQIKNFKVYVRTIGYNGGLHEEEPKEFLTEEEVLDFIEKSKERISYFGATVEQIRYCNFN